MIKFSLSYYKKLIYIIISFLIILSSVTIYVENSKENTCLSYDLFIKDIEDSFLLFRLKLLYSDSNLSDSEFKDLSILIRSLNNSTISSPDI